MRCIVTGIEVLGGIDILIQAMQQEVLSLRAKVNETQNSINIIKEQQPSVQLSDEFGQDADGYHVSYYDYLLQCNDNGQFTSFASTLNEMTSPSLLRLLRYNTNEFKDRYISEIHKKLLVRLDKGGMYGH